MEVETNSPAQEASLPEDNSLRIYLSRPTDPNLCSFWVGVYKKGQGDSKEFLGLSEIDKAFDYLQTSGLREGQPLMLSDNTGSSHRQFFLLPEKLLEEGQDSSVARALILKTIESLGQKQCGFYLSSKLISLGKTHEILAQLIAGLSKTTVSEIYLLTGDIGVNQLLNTSLYVKERLRDTRNVWVFH